MKIERSETTPREIELCGKLYSLMVEKGIRYGIWPSDRVFKYRNKTGVVRPLGITHYPIFTIADCLDILRGLGQFAWNLREDGDGASIELYDQDSDATWEPQEMNTYEYHSHLEALLLACIEAVGRLP